MITKTKSIYYCEHNPCKKKNYSKNAMEKHESICFFNPANKVACSDCLHCEPTKVAINETEYSRGTDINAFYCSKRGVNIYPKKAERLVLKYPETFEDQIPMPKECEFWKSDSLPFGDFNFLDSI